MGKADGVLAEMRREPYSLLDIYEATARYLSTADTPKSSSEIAAALRAGGFKTHSRKLVNTVRVMLRRKDGRTTGISVTKDGKRWFVKRKRPIRGRGRLSRPKIGRRWSHSCDETSHKCDVVSHQCDGSSHECDRRSHLCDERSHECDARSHQCDSASH